MTDNPHYVTPEEADLKFCPVKHGMITGCDGPKCMAWQWHRIKYDNEKDPETNSWKTIFSTTHGYCGMVRS
jgi:hypothetical protein